MDYLGQGYPGGNNFGDRSVIRKKLKNEESIKVATLINICSKLNFTKLFLVISKLDNLVKCYRSGSHKHYQAFTVAVFLVVNGHFDFNICFI